MQRLSDKCRKAALQNPCAKAAEEAAWAICKDVDPRGRGACMGQVYELKLIEKCGQIVCPNDPFMIKETGTSSAAFTTQQRASEGGILAKPEASVTMQTSFDAPESGGGVDPSKMRLYLGLGIGVVVLLIMAKK